MKLMVVSCMLSLVVWNASGQRFGKTLKDTPGMVSYTYRHSFQKDVSATLDTIKSLGVTNMEFSNLFGRTAANIKKLLDEL